MDTPLIHRLAPLRERSLTVLVDVSNRCNIRCRMCYYSFDSVFHREPVFTTPEQFSTWAADLLPLAHSLHLACGSESMTSPHFAEILRIAGQYGVPDVKFLTNALLMDESIRRAILDGGVHQVHISIDGATRGTYEAIRVGGRFEQLRENVAALAQLKAERGVGLHEAPRLQFNLTLMRDNLEELPLFVDLAEELGVTRIAARHLMPYEGLDITDQSLSMDKGWANEGFRRFFERVEASASVVVSNFPDEFGSAQDVEPPVEEADSPPMDPNDLRRPFGAFDGPAQDRVFLEGSVELRGWVLSESGPVRVLVAREPLPEDDEAGLDRRGLIRIGTARSLTGMRSDVAERYRALPGAWNCAWSFIVERDALPTADEIVVHALAEGSNGRMTHLGSRVLECTAPEGASTEGTPHLYCRKPFEGIYVDSAGSVYPYPDCQTVAPFGRLGEQSLEDIWYGPAFDELRQQILEGSPPPMCLTCPDFINRNVDDEAFFQPRSAEDDYRLPIGHLDQPAERLVEIDGDSLTLSGWALGFEEFAGVEVQGKRPEDGTWVPLGRAQFESGTRPDVARKHPKRHQRERAGWTYRLAREEFGSRPLVRLRILALNSDGGSTLLGQRTLVWRTAARKTSTK
jgi:MoaA/NifB/PqqE/SkfB family radical SAM enzyme